ncbi:MAG: alkaline phosphatase D family protein [Planctomycetia bacterium]
MVRLMLAALLAGACSLGARAAELDPLRPLTRIAVGSCIRQDKPQPIWQAVAAFAPDVLLLLGDNVYGDTEDMVVLREKYGRLAANPGFAAVRKQVPIIAVWDDHDFGADDAGREYPLRRESQQVFLDFFGVAADSPLRKQEGIYRAVTVGPPGKRVQFICLDARYHRSPPATMPLAERIKGKGKYVPTDDQRQTVLGDAQWAWLAGVLREAAEVRVVLSSIQVAATEHHHEHWGNFPRERARLLQAFRDASAGGLVVVSGDRHAAEISRIPAGDAALAYPLYDLTASSLNQGKGAGDEPNRLRVGRRYGDVNFGTIEIDWGGVAAGPRLTLAVRDERGAVVSSAGLPLVTLIP